MYKSHSRRKGHSYPYRNRPQIRQDSSENQPKFKDTDFKDTSHSSEILRDGKPRLYGTSRFSQSFAKRIFPVTSIYGKIRNESIRESSGKPLR